MTNKSMDLFLHGEGERINGLAEANFEKKIFKVYKFGDNKKSENNTDGDIHSHDEDL
jgi:hypothetical protein